MFFHSFSDSLHVSIALCFSHDFHCVVQNFPGMFLIVPCRCVCFFLTCLMFTVYMYLLFFNIVAFISALCAVVNAHGKVGSFQLSKQERQQEQQTTLLHITNNTINNSKPTATTIVKAQRKHKSISILEGSGRAWRLSPAQSRKPKVNKSQKANKADTKSYKNWKKRTKTTEKYRKNTPTAELQYHVAGIFGKSQHKAAPQKHSKILWVT